MLQSVVCKEVQPQHSYKLQAPVKWLCCLWLLGNVHYACVGGREKCGCAICTNLRKPCSKSELNAFPQEWLGPWGTVGFSGGVCGLCANQSAEPTCQAGWRCLPRDTGTLQPQQEPLCMWQFQNRTLALKAGHWPDSKHAPATSSCSKLSTIIPFSFMINCNFSQTFNYHYSLPTPPIFACISMQHFWSWDHTQEYRVKMATNIAFVREECFACRFLLNHWKWHTQTRNCLSGARP